MSTQLGMPVYAPAGVGHLSGPETFPDAAHHELANTQLRRNLGGATATIRAKREAVVAEVPDWEQLRLAGSAIKADVMARLPELLVQLEEQVQARGGTVHWARDATEANAIVVDLVRSTGSDEVVKVKSMATQEIGLNEALEDRAYRDRPRRAHRAAWSRHPQPHPGARHPPQPRRDPRDLPTRHARRGPRAE